MGDFERRVLQLVADGKITPAEGDELLHARDKGPLNDLRGIVEGGIADMHRVVRDVTEDRSVEILDSPLEVSDEPLTLRVTGDYGLRIQPSGAGTCRAVWRVGRALFGDSAEPPQVRLEGRTLYVESRSRMRFGWSFSGATLDVYVPSSTVLAGSIAQRNGRVELGGLSVGDLQIEALNGRVQIEVPVLNDLAVESRNGSIKVFAGQGRRLKVDAANGRVAIQGTLQDIDATTHNGGITADLGAVRGGRCQLHTVNGSVSMELPADVAVDLRAETVHGPLAVDVRGLSIAEDIRDYTRRRLHGRVQGGTGDIAAEVRSTNGAVRITQRLR